MTVTGPGNGLRIGRLGGVAWLVRDGEVLASLDIADSRAARRKGLIGTERPDSVLYLPKTRSVHTFGMRYALDVAFVDAELKVLKVVTVAPFRVTRWVAGSAGVFEAEAGCFGVWNLSVGDELEIR